jgi:hypothetical protein
MTSSNEGKTFSNYRSETSSGKILKKPPSNGTGAVRRRAKKH